MDLERNEAQWAFLISGLTIKQILECRVALPPLCITAYASMSHDNTHKSVILYCKIMRKRFRKNCTQFLRLCTWESLFLVGQNQRLQKMGIHSFSTWRPAPRDLPQSVRSSKDLHSKQSQPTRLEHILYGWIIYLFPAFHWGRWVVQAELEEKFRTHTCTPRWPTSEPTCCTSCCCTDSSRGPVTKNCSSNYYLTYWTTTGQSSHPGKINSTSGAPGGEGVETSLLELKKQRNFADITQFLTLCYIYFSQNNHLSCY